MEVFDGLLDEAGLLTADADPESVLRRYAAQLTSSTVRIGRLVVLDTTLAATARRRPAGDPLATSVVVTGGAGAVVALAGRTVPGLRVAAVEAALRDLDDLAGNAVRLAAAARELADEVVVHVGLPTAVAPTSPSWQRAVETVESAGLLAGIDAREPGPALAARLSTLVEADLGFKLTGVPAERLPAVIAVVDALVEGADPEEAAVITAAEPVTAIEIAGWEGARQARVRRRLVSCDCIDPGTWLRSVLRDGPDGPG